MKIGTIIQIFLVGCVVIFALYLVAYNAAKGDKYIKITTDPPNDYTEVKQVRHGDVIVWMTVRDIRSPYGKQLNQGTIECISNKPIFDMDATAEIMEMDNVSGLNGVGFNASLNNPSDWRKCTISYHVDRDSITVQLDRLILRAAKQHKFTNLPSTARFLK